jgi:hypothetical protein
MPPDLFRVCPTITFLHACIIPELDEISQTGNQTTAGEIACGIYRICTFDHVTSDLHRYVACEPSQLDCLFLESMHGILFLRLVNIFNNIVKSII